MAVEKSILIERSPRVVFTYLADFERHSEWAGHRLRVVQTSPGPSGLGATFASVGHQMGQDHEENVTITEFEADRLIAFGVQGGLGVFHHQLRLEEIGHHTRLTKSAEQVRLFRLVVRIFAPAFNKLILPRILQGDLRRIKARLEENAER